MTTDADNSIDGNSSKPTPIREPIDTKSILVIDKKFEAYDRSGNKKVFSILDHDIKQLKAQALVDGDTFVCIYLPTAIEEYKAGKDQKQTTDWQNQGYFVINKKDGPSQIRRELKVLDDNWLQANFKINLLQSWQPRWDFADILAWKKATEPTNPAELLALFYEKVRMYLDYDPEETYTVFILWIIGTYFYQLFNTYPYLDFIGVKRAGKTKALEIIFLTAFNPIISADFTGSTIFRLVEQTNATLLLDEAEEFKNYNKSESVQHIKKLLNEGFKKNKPSYRTNTDSKKVEAFDIYSPKALGHINSLDNILEDRCLEIVMKRSTNMAIQNTHPKDDDFGWSKIRSYCYRLFLEYAPVIETFKQKAEESMPVFGRERELFLPILTLARFFEAFGVAGVSDAVIRFAKLSHKEKQTTDEDENPDYKIIKFIEAHIDDNDDWRPTSKLYELLESTAKEYGIDLKYYSARTLGHALKRLGLPKDHKRYGTAWQITKGTVQKAKGRLGFIEEENVTNVTLSQSGSKQTILGGDNVVGDSERMSQPEIMSESDIGDKGDNVDSNLDLGNPEENVPNCDIGDKGDNVVNENKTKECHNVTDEKEFKN